MEQVTHASDAYRVLNIRRDAHQIVVKAAFHALASLYHPDVNPSPDAAVRMAELNKAYAALRTPDLRMVYDQVGSKPQPSAKAWQMGAAAAPPRHTGRSDSMVIDFGRYDGWTIADLAVHDPDYLRWLGRHTSGVRYRGEIERQLVAAAPAPKAPSRPQSRRWSRLGI